MGSDDFGKLWVNGELVWTSGTDPQSFRINQHLAAFRLRAGINELLFRCENHGGTMGWGVVVHPQRD